MKANLVELLELYEYKVDDLEAGREPKNGLVSVAKLRQTIIQLEPVGAVARRFRDVDNRFKAYRPGYKPAEEKPMPEIGMILVEDEIPDPGPERHVLEQLAQMVYWAKLERSLVRASRRLVQGKRDDLRMAYATVHNLDSYSKTDYFTQDYNLSRFTLYHPIPNVSDPAIQADDPSGVAKLLMRLFKQAYGLSGLLGLPSDETVPYIKRLAKRILDSEGALKPSGGGPSLDELRRTLDEARRQKLPNAEIRQLEIRVQSAATEDRRMFLIIEEDRNRFLSSIERLAILLSRYLPNPKGEASLPQIPQHILGALSPDYAIASIPNDARATSLRISAQQIKLWNHPMAILETSGSFVLSIAGKEHSLEEADSFTITLEDSELHVFRHQDYLHLRLEAREAATLSSLLAEGRVMTFLMWPEQHFGYLRLLRAFSARLKGETNYAEYGADTAVKYTEAPVDNLQEFARKGLEVVRTRVQKTPDWKALLFESGEALGLGSYAQTFTKEFSEWIDFNPNVRDTLAGQAATTTVGDTPSLIRGGGASLSLRYQNDSAVVSSPGVVPRKLQDLLVWMLPEGGLVVAKEGTRVAHAHVLIDPTKASTQLQ
jgi:hypothetical protein